MRAIGLATVIIVITAIMTLDPSAGRAGPATSLARGGTERQLTRGVGGRILANTAAWSPDSRWLVYDVRSDAAGDVFDGSRIEMVDVENGEVKVLYQSVHGAHCGVVTFHPIEPRVAFILGPEHPTPDWQYSVSHRQGVIVETSRPGLMRRLDARDLRPPFTPGALRGGTHVHVWDAAGDWLSFTYNDALVESDIRDVGVCIPGHPVRVAPDHPRNHDGECFTVVASRTVAAPRPGSDEINRAFEEGWIGTNGYVRADGVRQRRALACQGRVVTLRGDAISEVFVIDLPEDLRREGDGPLAGTRTHRPWPPAGVAQRRLTFTAGRKHPGLQGPRHWLRSSPDGSRVAFLMKDDDGIVQLWTVSPSGGDPVQLTRNAMSVSTTFTWSPDGRYLAHGLGHRVALTEAISGVTVALTPDGEPGAELRPESCVFSPDQRRIACVRRLPSGGVVSNQIFVLTLEP